MPKHFSYYDFITGNFPKYSFDIETDSIHQQINQFTKRMVIKVKQDQYKRNKFYIGSDSIFGRNWGRRTLPEAIKHAQELMEEQDKEEVFIVKIVKVVRRKRAPIEVVDV